MATIKDIAKQAGVSFTTVSNVIHGNTKKVSPATIDKINHIMKEMNYIPNMGARMLVGSSSKIIGVVCNFLPDEEMASLHDPFISEILGEIEKELRTNGYYMMLYASKSTKDIAHLIATWNVDGVILVGLGTEACREIRKQIRIPAIYTDCYFAASEHCINVGTADEEGGYLAVKYLISHGHKKIGYVDDGENQHAEPYQGAGAWRIAGYKRAMQEAGLPCPDSHVLACTRDIEKQKQLLERLYQRLSEFTALIFNSDYYAIQAMDYLRHKGVQIPEDVSVVGFDDIVMARYAYPRLTTIRQEIGEKGKLAVKQMIMLLESGTVEESNISLPVRLIERESVKTIVGSLCG